jgi:hypothetical protein
VTKQLIRLNKVLEKPIVVQHVTVYETRRFITVSFYVLKGAKLLMLFFRVVTPCGLERRQQSFGETYCFIFNPENGDSTFLRNVCLYILVHTASHPFKRHWHVHHRVHNSPLHASILCRTNAVNILLPYYFNNVFNIILPSNPDFPVWSLPFLFST